MSEVIWISTETPVQPIESRLHEESTFLQEAGIQLNTEVSRTRLFQFVSCQVSYSDTPLPKQEGRLLFRQYVANVLSDVLVDDWQPRVLSRLLQRHYGFFSEVEQAEIVDKAMQRLALADSSAPIYQTSRKSRVREALSKYLSYDSFVNLEGFMNFRLRFYQNELDDVLRPLVDEYLGAREEREFIRLLQSFLQILEPKCDTAHLLITGESQFTILDEQGEVLRSDVMEMEIVSDNDHTEEYEDVMISALLSIAPRHLVIHAGTFASRPDVLETLRQIWQRRVEVCTDCDLCARLLFHQHHPDQV